MKPEKGPDYPMSPPDDKPLRDEPSVAELDAALLTITGGESLDITAARRVFRAIAKGIVPDPLLAGLLIALKKKGESPSEIAGAALAFREAAEPFDRPEYTFADCCGTGGDGQGTINISTAAAIVASSAGLSIAKHGNGSISSRSGSADVLCSLGVPLEIPPSVSRYLLDTVGLCFLYAPQYHPGAKRTARVRRALGTRTIMNLLGPLLCPARPKVQLIGVYDAKLVLPIAEVLRELGSERALVVHGGGLDEIALHARTSAARLKDGEIQPMVLDPSDAGLPMAPIEALRGGGPEENATLLTSALTGHAPNAHVSAIAMNAGALLWIADEAPTFRAGTDLALKAIRTKRAYEKLIEYRSMALRALTSGGVPRASA